MQPQHFKSRSLRQVKVRTPSGKVNVHYEKRKPKVAKCAICGKPLKGVPREIPSRMRKLSKTEKRPERPFGGYICSECLRKIMKDEIREKLEEVRE